MRTENNFKIYEEKDINFNINIESGSEVYCKNKFEGILHGIYLKYYHGGIYLLIENEPIVYCLDGFIEIKVVIENIGGLIMSYDDWNLEDEEILKPIPKNNYECKGCDNKTTPEEDLKNHGYCSKCISDTKNYLNQDYTIQLINGKIWLNNHINRTKIILTEKEINHINNLICAYKNKKVR